MRRRLFQILQANPTIGLQRAVELLGEAGVREGDTVRRMRQPTFRSLIADEHTAQITNDRRIELENNFKAAAEAPLNVLACSPTMEMGIDVGGLDAVVMRHVPPRPDN